jgi:L-arabinonolactonase
MEVRLALDAKAALGEGPVWCPRENALYWVDSLEPALKRFAPDTGETRSWPMPHLIGSLALRERGGAVVALRRGMFFLDFATGATTQVFGAPEEPNDTRFNDGKCDRRGRFWAGTMHFNGLPRLPKGSLYRLDPDLRCTRMESGIRTSNGLGWSPDNRLMYYTDTRISRIDVFDFDMATGSIANRRPFTEVPQETGMPDGLTVDAEGCVWSANWDGWRLVRYAPDGRIERVVKAARTCSRSTSPRRGTDWTNAPFRSSRTRAASSPSSPASPASPSRASPARPRSPRIESIRMRSDHALGAFMFR